MASAKNTQPLLLLNEKTLLDSIKPYLNFAFILGCFPFSLDNKSAVGDEKQSTTVKWSIMRLLYCISLNACILVAGLIVYINWTFESIPHILDGFSAMHQTMYGVIMVICFNYLPFLAVAYCLCVLFTWPGLKNVLKDLGNLNITNQDFRDICGSKGFLVNWATFGLLLTIVMVAFASNSAGMILIPGVLSQIRDCWVAGWSFIVGGIGDLMFCAIMAAIESGLKTLVNKKLEALSHDCNPETTDSTMRHPCLQQENSSWALDVPKKVNLDCWTSSITPSSAKPSSKRDYLDHLRIQHSRRLCAISRDTGKCFGAWTGFACTSMLIQLDSNALLCLFTFTKLGGSPHLVKNLLFFASMLVTTVLRVALLCTCASRVQEEAEKAGQILGLMSTSAWEPEVVAEVSLFQAQIKTNRPDVDVFGYFRLSKEFLLTILGVATSHFIVIVEFTN